MRIAALLVLVACGGASPAPATRASTPVAGGGAPAASSAEDELILDAGQDETGDPESAFGPLEVGADYATYKRVTSEPFLSLVHGNRWVHVYVNAIGASAYLDGGDIPVGTKIVKASWLDRDGRPSPVPGPIYVMEKRAPGYAPDHDDWYYAIHWAKPTGKLASGGPIYWRGASKRAAFCWDCHDSYARSLGGLTPSSLLPR